MATEESSSGRSMGQVGVTAGEMRIGFLHPSLRIRGRRSLCQRPSRFSSLPSYSTSVSSVLALRAGQAHAACRCQPLLFPRRQALSCRASRGAGVLAGAGTTARSPAAARKAVDEAIPEYCSAEQTGYITVAWGLGLSEQPTTLVAHCRSLLASSKLCIELIDGPRLSLRLTSSGDRLSGNQLCANKSRGCQ